ncbi:MAG: hypothetical protein ACLR6B_20040 [Blautia sp.]
MLESIEGSDLRDMTDELAKAAAKSIVQIQNAFLESSGQGTL